MSAEAMVLGGLSGDAISLGPHWIYDQEEIARKIGRPEKFHDPISGYHPGKKAGDLTHYGDQVLVLLEHLAETKRFVLGDYAKVWRAWWEDAGNTSYRDGATRGTLANLAKGVVPEEAGAASHDLAGVSIIAPLFLLRWKDDEELLDACGRLTAFTHNDRGIVVAAEFFGRVMLAASGGKGVTEAVEAAAGTLGEGILSSWLTAAEGSARSGEKDASVLEEHGLSCNIDGAFAGVCHLLLRYPEDPFTALVENAAAGGDNAARGMALGMVYGAAGLTGKLPPEWEGGLKCAASVRKWCREAGD